MGFLQLTSEAALLRGEGSEGEEAILKLPGQQRRIREVLERLALRVQ
jgi:hypothetical protein